MFARYFPYRFCFDYILDYLKDRNVNYEKSVTIENRSPKLLTIEITKSSPPIFRDIAKRTINADVPAARPDFDRLDGIARRCGWLKYSCRKVNIYYRMEVIGG